STSIPPPPATLKGLPIEPTPQGASYSNAAPASAPVGPRRIIFTSKAPSGTNVLARLDSIDARGYGPILIEADTLAVGIPTSPVIIPNVIPHGSE
ncbi:hypothetical protein HAX54_010306, partial [Datura stramonium]|nr:hypothetical protein [Datura stramonium]